jgi:hypothetical protein
MVNTNEDSTVAYFLGVSLAANVVRHWHQMNE